MPLWRSKKRRVPRSREASPRGSTSTRLGVVASPPHARGHHWSQRAAYQSVSTTRAPLPFSSDPNRPRISKSENKSFSERGPEAHCSIRLLRIPINQRSRKLLVSPRPISFRHRNQPLRSEPLQDPSERIPMKSSVSLLAPLMAFGQKPAHHSVTLAIFGKKKEACFGIVAMIFEPRAPRIQGEFVSHDQELRKRLFLHREIGLRNSVNSVAIRDRKRS